MTRLFARSGVGLGLVLGLVAAAGCGSSSNPPTGKACVMNTECNNPLACTFGKCHVQCIETRDCPAGQRCVKATGGNVCQLDEEKRCPPTGACMQPLICAIDLQCRNNCTSATDCPVNQMCASGSCAEASEVGPDGKLKVTDAGAGGSGGSTGGSGGSPGTGGAPGVDAGADAPPSGTIGPCGIPDTEPNDTRDKSVAITVPAMFTSCLGTRDDIDFYEITAPSDAGGGYFEYSLTGSITAELDVIVYSVADNGKIDEVLTDSGGQDLHAFLAAAAGQKYRLAVSAFAGVGMPPEKYNFKISYTRVVDMYEPNDTRETAKPIALGTAITAFMHDGYKSAILNAENIADWYVVTAGAGNIVVNLESVPTSVTGDITIIDSTGKMENRVGGNNGQNVMEMMEGVTAGPVLILIKPFFVSPDLFSNRQQMPGMLPDQITRAYKLTVTQ